MAGKQSNERNLRQLERHALTMPFEIETRRLSLSAGRRHSPNDWVCGKWATVSFLITGDSRVKANLMNSPSTLKWSNLHNGSTVRSLPCRNINKMTSMALSEGRTRMVSGYISGDKIHTLTLSLCSWAPDLGASRILDPRRVGRLPQAQTLERSC